MALPAARTRTGVSFLSWTDPALASPDARPVCRFFARIDAAGRGRITFDDYLRYLRAQGAEL